MKIIKNRRSFLKTASSVSLALCSGLVPVAHSYGMAPAIDHLSKSEKVLYAFVTTIIPGMKTRDRTLIAHFYDSDLQFKKIKSIFLLQLRCTSRRLYDNPSFYELTYEQRVGVIEDGLRGKGLKSKIFNKAIFLTQVAVYCDIYDQQVGSELFTQGTSENHQMDSRIYHYEDLPQSTAEALTVDGNFN